MYNLILSDTLTNNLKGHAAKRGESLDNFALGALELLVDILGSEQPKSLAEALREARAKIDASGLPLIHTWEELEAEIAERRGGYYRE